MYQICENCYEYELVYGTVSDCGDGDYEIDIDAELSAWERCPSCGIELNGDTDRAQLSWSIYKPTVEEVKTFRTEYEVRW